MTWPRRFIPGTTYVLTRRCTQRRFMLVPRGIVPKLFGFCVALAAERHGILVHRGGRSCPLFGVFRRWWSQARHLPLMFSSRSCTTGHS